MILSLIVDLGADAACVHVADAFPEHLHQDSKRLLATLGWKVLPGGQSGAYLQEPQLALGSSSHPVHAADLEPTG